MRSHAIRYLPFLGLCLAVGLSTACNRNARGGEAVVAITDMDVGRSLKSDKTIDDHTTAFRPSDVVYVSIGTKGEGKGTVHARWIYGDNQVLATESRDLGPDKPQRVEFHLSNPKGLAKGDYHVEITLNDVAQGNKTFSVD